MTSFYTGVENTDYTALSSAAELAASAAAVSAAAALVSETNSEDSSVASASYAAASAVSAANSLNSATNAANSAIAAAASAVDALANAASILPIDASGVLTNDGAGLLTWETVSGFDATANQTITGEYTFNTSGNKDFIVTDDPTFTAPNATLALFDHNATVDPTGVYYLALASTTAGANTGTFYIDSQDDGSAASGWNLNNASGSATMSLELAIGGATEATLQADALTITSIGTEDTDGISIAIDTDTKLIGKDGHSTLGDYWTCIAGATGVFAPNYILNRATTGSATASFGVGTSTIYGLNVSKTTGTNLLQSKMFTPNGNITIGQDTGTSTSAISLEATGIAIAGVVLISGHKTGTLASPPGGLIIGEWWVDTTDSSQYPIMRVRAS